MTDDDPTTYRRRLMGTMMDLFGWSPDTFWRATLHEVLAAIEARQRANKQLTGA